MGFAITERKGRRPKPMARHGEAPAFVRLGDAGARKRNLGIRMLAPPTRASGAGLAQHTARHCAFAATTHRNRRSSGRRVSRSFVVGSERLGEAPTVAKTFSNASGSEHSGDGWLTVARSRRLGGWHPNAPSPSQLRAGVSCIPPDASPPR
jgi:hypothetical protein